MNAVPSLSELKPHKLTVDELLSLLNSGALDGLPRMELLDGVLYEMSPQRSEHVVVKNEIGYRLRRALENMNSQLVALIEPTIRIDDVTAAEPDVGVMTQPRVDDFYPAAMVRLAVEVSLTTLRTDMGYKRSIYAQLAIAEYWVADINSKRIFQFSNPQAGCYPDPSIVDFGQSILSATIPGLTISTVNLI